MAWLDRVTSAVTAHSWVVIVAMLLATAALAPGLAGIEESSSVGDVSEESDVEAAYDEVQQTFSPNDPNTTTTVIAVSNEAEDGNVLSRESLLRSLRYQQSLHDNETLNATLVDEQAVVGIENIVAQAALEAERQRQVPRATVTDWEGSQSDAATDSASEDADADRERERERAPPTLDEQIEQLESMNDSAVTAVVEQVLDTDQLSEGSQAASRMLPRTYESGSTTADARLIVITQETEGEVRAAAGISANVSEGQAAARSLAIDRDDDEAYHVFSRGLIPLQQDMAIQDSLAILGPLALAFVFVSLSLAYRDPVDVVLGLLGVIVVLLWTMGAIGWLGIEFGPAMIAVPILLIALSVDYALHVTMRYREERVHEDTGVRDAMVGSLRSVGPALVLVTMTTAIGFFANYTSPFDDVQVFGLATALGIVATLFVFLLLIPALKTVIGSALERRGWDRTPSVPGSSGRFSGLLGGGATIASRAPAALLVAVLLLSTGAAYGATGVEVSADQELFMADDPPEWTEDLPDAIEPGEFFLKENREYIFSQFQSPDKQGYVLVEGNVTHPETLDRVAAANSTAADADAVFEANGDPEIETPLSAMRLAAAQNETFNATLTAADTDGDDVPDRNLETVYDEFYGAAPTLAAQTLQRTDDGEYTALRVRIATDGNADRADAVAVVRDAATAFDGVDALEATATGQPIVEKELNDDLSTSMVESVVLTSGVILLLLMGVFRLQKGSASLGAITLLPVMISVTWLFGTMALLDIPISIITALVGSISIGLGVDYAIHISERYWEEYSSGSTSAAALSRTVSGTGSAVMSSAITTATGFGVLAFALLPGLRQFGFILAVGIVYSFLATVYVQPSILALWARYAPGTTAHTESAVASSDD